MRTLNRNKSTFYYATFVKREEITDEYDNKTGAYTITYSSPVAMSANISAARGTSDTEVFGISLSYDKTIITDNTACPIDETSILWIDKSPELDDEGKAMAPYDYIVKRVARSLNSIAYAVQKVDVSFVPETEPEEQE